MDTSTYWQLEKEYYTLANDSDLVLRVVEQKAVSNVQSGVTVVEKKPHKIHEFKLNRALLVAASSYFKQALSTDDKTTFDLEEIDGDSAIQALHHWFKLIHGVGDTAGNMEKLTITEVWWVCVVWSKYGFDATAEYATTWFNTWWNAQPSIKHFGYKDYELLLYPAYLFSHYAGFAQATKYLAYRSTGTVMSRSPFPTDLNIPSHVLNQINGAKNRLKTVLHRSLYTPIDNLLKHAKCQCAPYVLYAYEQALTQTGVWPLESKLQGDSVNQTLRELEGIGDFVNQVKTCGHPICTFNYTTTVSQARNECANYFDGLCLDCMATSCTEDDAAYWQRSERNVQWNHGCRLNHGQPSWYFSFMGPRGKMLDWVKGARMTPSNGGGKAGNWRGGGTRGNGASRGNGKSGKDTQAAAQDIKVVVGGEIQGGLDETGALKNALKAAEGA